ncbi:MAG: hypothetical protein JW839_20010 [Candidatus Lokiarchaeota archaeon]|nr:hypothetical protein [Candidatus Lokiarchaeota archaeon]
MGGVASDERAKGRLTEKERLVKERLLLEKEHEVVMRQASEVREEYRRLQGSNGDRPKRKVADASSGLRQLAVRDFIDHGNDSGYATMLRDAITFCETHDGCPFFAGRCTVDGAIAGCRGVWIKMGAPCPVFAENLKRCIKESSPSEPGPKRGGIGPRGCTSRG